jgi:hypothetical protein
MKLSEVKAEAERALKYKRQCDCGRDDQRKILALVAVAEQAQVLTSGIRRWNEEVQGVIGRQPDYRWPALDEAESALAELEAL